MSSNEFYITPDDYRIAEENGIDKRTLEQRVREYGWDKDRAITEPKKVRINRDYWISVALSNGISRDTFHSRVSTLKWSEEKAATTPIIESKGPKSKFDKEVIEKVQANGISMDCFRRRIREGWDMEIACTLKPLNQNEVLERMHAAIRHNDPANTWYL